MNDTTVAVRVPVVKRPPRRRLLGRLLTKPLAAVSVMFLLAFTLTGMLAPWVSPYDPLASDFLAAFQLPSAQHLLGTDNLGRDILSRIIYSAGPAMLNTTIAVLTTLVVAIPIGVYAGYARGWVDAATVRISEVTLAIPAIAVLLMVLAFFGQAMSWVIVVYGLLASPAVTRVVRSASIAVSEEPYIDAAKVSGLRSLPIVWRHVRPRVSGPIVINLAIVAAGALLVSAGLNFLGLGITPPDPSLGSMIAEGNTYLQRQPWLIVPPTVTLTLVVISFLLFGDGLRDAITERWDGSQLPRKNRRSGASTANNGAQAESQPPVTPVGLASDVTDPIVQVENLSIGYRSEDSPSGYIDVVSSVSFKVGRAETLGLVGESGCGKTTTSMAILGLLGKGGEIRNGSIIIDGTPTSTMNKRVRERLRGGVIALISQEPMAALDPLYTVGNQLGEAVRRHTKLRGRAAQARVMELLAQVRINDPAKVAKSYPFEISGGMAQRVSIAVALAGDPELLIADEPTTALDVTVQAEILDLLRAIQKERNMGLLLVTHNFGVVADLCDRVAVMKDGRIVELADVERLFDNPEHDYTKLLLASTLEEGTVREPLAFERGDGNV